MHIARQFKSTYKARARRGTYYGTMTYVHSQMLSICVKLSLDPSVKGFHFSQMRYIVTIQFLIIDHLTASAGLTGYSYNQPL